MTKKKLAKWTDNFKQEDNTPLEVIERPGICNLCGGGSFTLGLGKNLLKGQLLRLCKGCGMVVNPDTGEILKEGRKNEINENV